MDSTGTIPDYVDDQNLSGIDSMVSDIDLNNQNTVEDDGVSDLRGRFIINIFMQTK